MVHVKLCRYWYFKNTLLLYYYNFWFWWLWFWPPNTKWLDFKIFRWDIFCSIFSSSIKCYQYIEQTTINSSQCCSWFCPSGILSKIECINTVTCTKHCSNVSFSCKLVVFIVNYCDTIYMYYSTWHLHVSGEKTNIIDMVY